MRLRIRPWGLLAALCAGLIAASGPAAEAVTPQIEIVRHLPCNLFFTGESVKFNVRIRGAAAQKIALSVTDYHKSLVQSKEVVADPKNSEQTVDFGALPRGYYELRAEGSTDQGLVSCLKDDDRNGFVSFGVADRIQRSAQEVREGGYRFGMKLWILDKAWWRGNLDFNEKEALDASSHLGLQWTRMQMQQRGEVATPIVAEQYAMNVIMKVECFPPELYDSARYGPMADYEKVNGKGAWTKKTLPKKEGYQKWLREELQRIPRDQKVFEICNEAWDKMSAEDLATFGQWIAEVILPERPDAIIGPNLKGLTSPFQYDAQFIKAGGMKGMKMVALHPYTSLPLKPMMEEYRQWLREQTGQDIEIYITEYGTHSTPEGPAKSSEEHQAQIAASHSIELYTGGVKAMTPHWMGQEEQDRKYIEHWFGYFRLNQEPKPDLIAQANCARMIDGKRYCGDLWYGQGVGASLFEKNGQYTLALWTKAGDNRDLEIVTGRPETEVVDIVGASTMVKTVAGKLKVSVGQDPLYLVDVNPELEKDASLQTRPGQWPEPEKAARLTRVSPKMKKPVTIDGDLADWNGALEIGMVNPKVNGADASGLAYITWDEHSLYVALNMRDNQVLNNRPLPKLYQQDCLELFISTEARDKHQGYGPTDFQFFITPTSASGKPIVAKLRDRESGALAEIDGSKYVIKSIKDGWLAEVAIPWNTMNQFVPAAGKRLALELRVNDADSTHERWKIDPVGVTINPEDPTEWSVLELQ